MGTYIRYHRNNNLFELRTHNSRYSFFLRDGQYLIHSFYTDRRKKPEEHTVSPRVHFSPYSEEQGKDFFINNILREFPGFEEGDYREAALKIRNQNGDCCTRFIYKKHQIFPGRQELPGLPFAEADETTETLAITLEDKISKCEVMLYYTVFAACDVISRYYTVTNRGKAPLRIERCMSLSLDLSGRREMDWISLPGQYFYERNIQRVPIFEGIQGCGSRRGASSHYSNPFFAVCNRSATETKGDVYGFNFVYSGNFQTQIEACRESSIRIQTGLGQDCFSWLLEPGESFTTPEAVMTYTTKGLGQMTRNFHRFIRNHILPKETQHTPRPVVLNTWEASYFDIDEAKMLTFAESAAKNGLDMLVMDDGWFGARNHDRAGLGDWQPNPEKFPNGLKAFADAVRAKGVQFGVWIEPEMINPDSNLYREHPEWCLGVAGRRPSLSRNQRILDMANPAVVAYLKEMFDQTFRDFEPDYFKWDMNRNMSETGSSFLPLQRQDETAYRYMLGVYDLFAWFRKRFPHAIIENCSGGGGRYDLGMMKYSCQIWTSDNTIPEDRVRIQFGSMMAYPAETMSCHVSNRKHLTEDSRYLNYAYQVALNGTLGYELHLPNMSQTVQQAIAEQIREYKTHLEFLIRQGNYYRVLSPFETPYSAYYFESEDQSHILLTFLQNKGETPRTVKLKLPSADQNARYRDRYTGEIYEGFQLKKGFTLTTSEANHFGRMWALEKI